MSASGRPAPRRVSRAARLADAAALLLVLSGAAAYLYAQYRMGELAAGRMQHERMTGPEGGWNIAAWGRMVTLSRVAIGLVAAGLVIGLLSFARHVLSRPSIPRHEQADDPGSR